MERLKIEEFIKPMKVLGMTKGAGNLSNGDRLEIDLEGLNIVYGLNEFQLDRIAGTKGGWRYFFLCPNCGRRCRVVYKEYLFYACGECQGIYKTTENRTKTDPQYYWELALKECKKVDPSYRLKNGYYDYNFPSRPKYMRYKKHLKHYRRFIQYMEKGDRLWIK